MNPIKILLAEAEPVTREKLTEPPGSWGFDMVSAAEGTVLQQPDARTFTRADVVMPGLSGDEFCRRAPAPVRRRAGRLMRTPQRWESRRRKGRTPAAQLPRVACNAVVRG